MDSSLSLSSVNSALPVVNNQTIVIIGIVLLLLLFLLYFNLYVNNISYTGNSLDWKATLKKLFRIKLHNLFNQLVSNSKRLKY